MGGAHGQHHRAGLVGLMIGKQFLVGSMIPYFPNLRRDKFRSLLIGMLPELVAQLHSADEGKSRIVVHLVSVEDLSTA